jgi:hypothetical protein
VAGSSGVQRYDANASPIGAPITPLSSFPESPFHPDVAVGPLGNFVVAWQIGGGFPPTFVRVRRFSADGSQVSTAAAVTPPVENNSGVKLAFQPSGEFLLAYRKDVDDVETVIGRFSGFRHLPALGVPGLAALCLLALAFGMRSLRSTASRSPFLRKRGSPYGR